MTSTDYELKLKRTERQRLHYERQRRMPPESRPRLSPRDNMPGSPQGVTREKLVSCRVCIEHPEKHPNDFRYLFRKTGSQNNPVFFWLDIDGLCPGNKVYPSIYQAIAPMVRAGWEDASW